MRSRFLSVPLLCTLSSVPFLFGSISTTTAYAASYTTISLGATGSLVSVLQQDLNTLGFSSGSVDGQFGPLTQSAVISFQKSQGLQTDGVVGPLTWGALTYAVANQKNTPPATTTGTQSLATSAPVGSLTTTSTTSSATSSTPTTANAVTVNTSASPTYTPALRYIYVNGNLVTEPNGFSYQGTEYMPIWYVMNALKTLGITSTFQGNVWAMTAPSTFSPNLQNIQLPPGSIAVSINGTNVEQADGIVTTDPWSHAPTEYFPVWFIMQSLQRLGIAYHWDGEHWYMIQNGFTDTDSTGQYIGLYSTLSDAENALATVPSGTVHDGFGNLVYTAPTVYTAYSSNGVIIGTYPDLTSAENDLFGYTGAVIKTPNGTVVYTTPASSSASVPSFTNVDLRHSAPQSITASAIDSFLVAHNSPLQGLGDTFMQAQSTYGIDANYLVSHAILESGWGTSTISQQKNNLFGYGAYDANPGPDAGTFPSDEYAIMFQAWEVRNNYLTPGSSLYVSPTLTGMNVHYATDPNWATSIGSLMNELASSTNDTIASYQQFTTSNIPSTPPSTTEPVFYTGGAQGVLLSDPDYNGVPYFPSMTDGESGMFFGSLSEGSIGIDVAVMQNALNQKINAQLTVDGDFGPMTQSALTQYQAKNNLPQTGVCDLATWQSLVGNTPTNTLPAGTTVSVDQIEQGMVGNSVTEWYHVIDGNVNGWIPGPDASLSNVYRVFSDTGYSVPIFDPTNPSQTIAVVHTGEDVVINNPTPVNGFIAISYADQLGGQTETGLISASQNTIQQIH